MWLIGGAVAAIIVLAVALIAVISGGDEGTDTASPTTTQTVPPSDDEDQTGGAETSATTTPPTATTTAPSSAGGAIDPSDLDRYLLTAAEVGPKFAGQDATMEASQVETQLVSGGTYRPAHCASAYGPVLDSTYAGSGYTGMAANVVSETPQANRQVLQAIVSFPDQSTAKAFFDEQMEAWQECRNVQISAVVNGEPSGAKLNWTTITDGVAGALLFPDVAPGEPNKTCQRAMSTKSNVVVDIRACSEGASNIANTGWTIARNITQKIS